MAKTTEKIAKISYPKESFVADVKASLAAADLDITLGDLDTIIKAMQKQITVEMPAAAVKENAKIALMLFGGTFTATVHEAHETPYPQDRTKMVQVPKRTQVKFSAPRKDVIA